MDWKSRIARSEPQAAPAGACLVLTYPPGEDLGRRFDLRAAENVVGRGGEADIVIDRDSVSRRHAVVIKTGERYAVQDLGSTNGTYVNDAAVQSQELSDGDLVKIGHAIFRFLSGPDLQAAWHEEIHRIAMLDGLTGAHNQRYLLEFLDREMARSIRYGRPLSVVLFDVDRFARVNEAHGHLTGDAVLRDLVRRLRGRIRKEELLARCGGEDAARGGGRTLFCAVLPETPVEGARDFGEQIRRLVEREPFAFEGERIAVTVSVGVAAGGPGVPDAQALLQTANDNLAQAKRAGRNQVAG